MKRLLLLLPSSGYRNEDFLAAAADIPVEVIGAEDRCGSLTRFWGGDEMLALPFSDPAAAARIVQARLSGKRPDAVLGVDDAGIEAAAQIASVLGLSANAPDAVASLRDKARFRLLQERIGLPRPACRRVPANADPATLVDEMRFPVVVKPLRLSGSRGVIRVDRGPELATTVIRVREILRRAETPVDQRDVLLEEYLPGMEVALEGLMAGDGLRVLAVFDKPDPLEGPYFAETLYVTPSRLPPETQRELAAQVQRACAAAGLYQGPVHAEARIHEGRVTLLEIAPRTIGGLCGRVLRHHLGMSLEQIVLRDALGERLDLHGADPRPSGVMMIPVPRAGILQRVAGVDAARAVSGIDEVTITARAEEIMAPLPEEASYVGFLFARADSVGEVERALRSAYRLLRIETREWLAAQAG